MIVRESFANESMVRYGLRRARYGIVTQNARQIMYKTFLVCLFMLVGQILELMKLMVLFLMDLKTWVIDSKNQVIILQLLGNLDTCLVDNSRVCLL